MLTRIARRFEPRIRRAISSTMLLAAKEVERTGRADQAVIQRDQEKKITKDLNALWLDASKSMYGFLFGEAKSIKAVQATLEPTVTANGVAKDFIATYGAKKIKQIVDTTITDIQRIVSGGIDDGLSEIELAKLIRATTPSISGSRAQTIARTETHGAAMFAAQMTAESTGVEMKREWVSAESDRTRETHAAAHGQIRGMNEPFNVGGASLMYPGDPSGPPEEVINCRCAVVFVL